MLSIVHAAAMDGDMLLVVGDYNVDMKGVSVGDQMASYYPSTYRSVCGTGRSSSSLTCPLSMLGSPLFPGWRGITGLQ